MNFLLLAIANLVCLSQAVDVQVVSVGENPVTNTTGLKFWPDKITAKPGSMVQFQFWKGNHTVTQSNFDNPCIPLSNVNKSAEGVYSGYMDVGASIDKGMIPVFTITVPDSKPIWLFCSQGKHCQAGMSMVINENPAANKSRTLDNYRTLSKSATGSNVVPLKESSSGTNSSAAASPAAGASSTAVAASSSFNNPSLLLLALGVFLTSVL